MGKIRERSGKLQLDFVFQAVRCREQTALTDTVENRRVVDKLGGLKYEVQHLIL